MVPIYFFIHISLPLALYLPTLCQELPDILVAWLYFLSFRCLFLLFLCVFCFSLSQNAIIIWLIYFLWYPYWSFFNFIPWSFYWSIPHLLYTIKILLLLLNIFNLPVRINCVFFSSVSQNTSHIHLKQKIQGSLCLAMVTNKAWNLSS